MSRPRGTSDKLYTTKAWRDLRKRILARDGNQCQIRLRDVCTGWATEVDHIIPRVEAPDLAMVPSNLRAACRQCNLYLGGLLGASRARRSSRRSRVAAADGFGSW